MNDIWVLPSGEWIVYSDEEDVIKDFSSLTDLQIVTSYHGLFKKHRAMQFRFINQPDLLHYICFKAGFNYNKTIKLTRTPGSRYNSVYSNSVTQPPLLIEFIPNRKKDAKTIKRSKTRSKTK